MVRKHGWKLPFHTLQVVAITVFSLLVVAFYIFLVPFIGGQIWEYILIGIYSPVALTVFILYVRSTAIDPADSGIYSKVNHPPINEGNLKSVGGSAKDLPGAFKSGRHSSPSLESRGSLAATNSNRCGSTGEALDLSNPMNNTAGDKSIGPCGMLFCGVFVHEDCRKEFGSDEQEGNGEDALYCTLCKAEVRKFSKHCRSCDKCVDGFDHHCKWLNNCVGRKNYYTFVSLMAISLVWLAIEAGVGVGVFVRCFVNRRSMESDIIDRLGNGFSRAPFAAVVAVCTVLSLLACIPLGELFFFHMILIRKGLTTFEYVVAMRAMSEAPPGEASNDEELLPNVIYSPSGSTTTGFSGGSSLGHHYKGAWCTPPRVFVDLQDEVVPHLDPGMVPSTIDPESAVRNKPVKRPIKRSAWKLSQLDTSEVLKAAAKARASSSVLRPVQGRSSQLHDPGYSSSGNMSIRSSLSTEVSGEINNSREIKNALRMPSLRNNSSALSQGSRDEYESGTHSMSSISSPGHVHEAVTLSPLPRVREAAPQFKPQGVLSSVPRMVVVNPAPPQPCSSVDPFPSISGLDEKKAKREGSTDPLLSTAATSASLLRDMKRTSVVWDQEAGRYVSVPATFSTDTRNQFKPSVAAARLSSTNVAGAAGYDAGRRPVGFQRPSQEPSSSGVTSSGGGAAAAPRAEPSEKLMYTGESIFFGGPITWSSNNTDGGRAEKERIFRPGTQRVVLPGGFSSYQDSRFKRGAGSNQLPVFAPGGAEQGHLR